MKKAIEDAVVKRGLKIAVRKDHCSFCDEDSRCIPWVPKRLPWVVPVCEQCFLKLHRTFGKTGAIIWE